MHTQKKIRENPLAVSFRQGEQAANVAKYEEELEQKSFYESSRLEYIVAKVSSYAANVVSIITGISFVLFGVASVLPSVFPDLLRFGLSGAVAVFVLIMLEIVKRSNTKSFFRASYIARKTTAKNTAALIVLSAFSVIISVLGAAELAEIATDKTEQIRENKTLTFAEIDEQAAAKALILEGEIKAIDERVKAQIKKGMFATMPASDAANIDGKRKEIESIREAAKTKKEEFAESNDWKLSNNETATEKAVLFMLVLSVLCEVCAILCIWFVVYYKYRVTRETRGNNLPIVQVERDYSENTQVNTQAKKEANTQVKTPHLTVEKIVGVQSSAYGKTRVCIVCSSKFTASANHQKYCTPTCRNKYNNQK